MIDINPRWFAGTQKLETLDLSYNKINRLSKETFKNLTNLRLIRLSRNDLNQLDDGVFGHLKKLKHLDIDGNKLRELKPEVFAGLNKLTHLEIRDLHEDFQLDFNFFKVMPSIEAVFMDERLEEEFKPELSKIYGSKIAFLLN